MVTRALCRYSYYDLASVPVALRESVLQVKLRQPDLYDDMGTAIAWDARGVAVWRWHRPPVQEAIKARRLKISEQFILPETLFQAPFADGVRLIKLASGYEAQHWQAGVLRHSRWWEGMPNVTDWQAFVRDSGLGLTELGNLPIPQSLPWQTQPWRLTRQLRGGLQWEASAYAMLFVMLALPCLWFGAETLKNWQALQKIDTEMVRLKKAAQPVIEAREQALQARGRAEQLLATDPWPDQLSLMAKMSEVLSKNTAWLSGWDFGQGKVKVTIESTVALSSSALVGDLQETGLFKNASVLAGGGARKAVIEMEVVKP